MYMWRENTQEETFVLEGKHVIGDEEYYVLKHKESMGESPDKEERLQKWIYDSTKMWCIPYWIELQD